MTILHVSADYPDPLASAKTPAIARLLALAPEREHRVYSINRVGWRQGIHALDFDDAAGAGHRAVAYGAPPKGVFLDRFLRRLADWIAEDAARRGLAPTLIHAHKLSVEGLVGLRLAERFGAPLAVTVQGDSDTKIVGAKRDLRDLYRRVWRTAAVVLPLAPWATDRLTAVLGPREGPVEPLPCVVGETLLAPVETGPVFKTALHLASASRKDVAGLIAAVGVAAARIPDIRLEIIGGGDPKAFARLAAAADRHAPGRVRFLGVRPGGDVPALLNGACALAMISKRESFGMVFAEALFAGAPCLGPRGWGVDGYVRDGEAVLLAPPGDPAAAVEALTRLAREEAAFKARLKALQDNGGLAVFTRAAIGARYRAAMAAIGPAAGAA